MMPYSHYNDVIMGAMASQITSLAIVYSSIYSGADQRKHQSSASLAFVRRIHRGPVNSPHKWPVTRKMFPFNDVIMLPVHHHASFGLNELSRRISPQQQPLVNTELNVDMLDTHFASFQPLMHPSNPKYASICAMFMILIAIGPLPFIFA